MIQSDFKLPLHLTIYAFHTLFAITVSVIRHRGTVLIKLEKGASRDIARS